jgi:thioredoxin reductase (NADPH)
VLESTPMGGQAGTSSRIRNFCGLPAGVSGGELTERTRGKERNVCIVGAGNSAG